MKHLIVTAAVMLGLVTAKAQLANTNSNQNVSLVLKNAISITVNSATGTSFSFDVADDYSNGFTNTSASSFQVRSNRPWAVTVNSAAANFTGPAAPSPTMPASALAVRLNGGSSFITLSTTATAFTSGARGSNSFAVDYKANPGFGYDAGTYTLGVVYTATQQ